MAERFFIVGCQRSGTTLLRLILETHPDVFCYDELQGYAVLQNSCFEYTGRRGLVGFKLPRWTEQLTCQVLFDEGPEGPCNNFYRREKILFLHRNVRDTIASMLKLKAGESNWCEIWVPRIIHSKVVRDEAFFARYATDFDLIEGCSCRLIGLAALYWKYKTESFFSYRDQGLPILAVSYEKLATDPRPTLQSICSHLEIPFHENLLRHQEFEHPEVFENGLTLGNTDPKRPIQLDSIEQWARFLSDDDLDVIDRICGGVSSRFAALFSGAGSDRAGDLGK